MAYRLRSINPRKKAPFGTEEAAILGAAAINVAGSLTAAGINSAATQKAAKDQATATTASAQKQAEALRQQSERAREYQQQSQDFIKEQNAENREIQKDIQMQLQMLTGQQNVNDRLEASKIKVKNGGSKNKKYGLLNGLKQSLADLNQVRINNPAGIDLRTVSPELLQQRNQEYAAANLLGMTGPIIGNGEALGAPYVYPQIMQGGAILADNATSPLRGRNIPFTITDGGGAIPLGTTEEGYDLYELYGNDHEHYHKTKSGKNKTGVGIKFADGNVIEGEGNQNTSRGEKLLVTPDNAYFISKHNIKGFNPAKAVDNGMNPMDAYLYQEIIKKQNGISDSGNKTSPVRKLNGGNLDDTYLYLYGTTPDYSSDITIPTATGTAYAATNQKKAYGGKGIRQKAAKGASWSNWYENGNLLGSALTGVGNIAGAAINTWGTKNAARTLADAYNTAGQTMADAYNSLKTIDLNSIRREDYAAAHAMPALQAPISQAEAQIVGVNRDTERRLSNIRRNSASSAAGNTRMANIMTDAQDARNRIYSADQQQMQAIRQANADRVNQAAMQNSQLDTQANQQYAGAYLNLLQYNNDIENQKILGTANALSDSGLQGANILANARTANANSWSNAITATTNATNNALTSLAKQNADFRNVALGATSDSWANYIAYNGSKNEINMEIAKENAIINNSTVGAADKAAAEQRKAILEAALQNRFK